MDDKRDPEAEPTGCDEGETCNEECVCAPNPPPTAQITAPDNNNSVTAPTTVMATAASPAGIEFFGFFLDGILQAEGFEGPCELELDPLLCPPGPHEISVEAHDTLGSVATDAILVNVDSF